ncbi:MAG: hypothetical protein IJT14_03445 [Rickettsiales bacterium]|nr:hypothetical protein [Rickettsiales bacterium]
MEKKLPTNVENKNKELGRLMKKTAETKEGLIFYSEQPLFKNSDKERNRKMALDFIESKLLDDRHKKTIEQQKDDLQLLNAFFEAEIKYLKQYSNESNVDITTDMIKTKFAEFLRGGREIDLTYQELTLFVNIIDDAQALMEGEKGKDKKAENDRLSNIEKNNPKLINAMKAQTEIYKRKTQINNNKNKVKKSVMPGNYQQLNVETQIEKQIKPEFKQNIQLNNININNANKDSGKMNLNNNHINIQKQTNKLNEQTSKIKNVDYDFDEDPKESSDIHAININEFLNQGTDMRIKKEQQKFKKIDVKKNDNMRRGTQIVDNINNINNDNLDNDQNKTFVNKNNPKKMFKNVLKLDNPQTAVINKGRNIWKNNNGIGNQSMMDPNMTSKTQIEDKKETKKTEVKFSKENVNDKESNINNQK